jgi:hypothetical protein
MLGCYAFAKVLNTEFDKAVGGVGVTVRRKFVGADNDSRANIGAGLTVLDAVLYQITEDLNYGV